MSRAEFGLSGCSVFENRKEKSLALKFSTFETKTRLSEILRLVKRGKRVIVSQRGQPVAQIIPYSESPKGGLQQRLKELESEGQLLARKKTMGSDRGVKSLGALERFLEDR